MLGLKLNHVNKRGHRSKQGELWTKWVKTLRKKQYGCTLQRIFSNSLLWVEIAFFIHVSLKLVLKGPVDIKPSLVQIMAPTGWQAIVGINNGPVIWRIDAFHGFNELNWVGILTAPLFRDACKCLRWLDHFKIQSPVFFLILENFSIWNLTSQRVTIQCLSHPHGIIMWWATLVWYWVAFDRLRRPRLN